MSKEEREDVRLGSWSPPEQYGDPDLEALDDKPWADVRGPLEPGDLDQAGEHARVFVLEGGAYAKDISVLQRYRGEILTLRHPAHTGTVYVESVAASARDTADDVTEFRFHDGQMRDVTETKPVYTYRVGLVQIEGSDTD